MSRLRIHCVRVKSRKREIKREMEWRWSHGDGVYEIKRRPLLIQLVCLCSTFCCSSLIDAASPLLVFIWLFSQFLNEVGYDYTAKFESGFGSKLQSSATYEST